MNICCSTTSTLSAGSTGSQARLIQSSHQPENYHPMLIKDLGKDNTWSKEDQNDLKSPQEQTTINNIQIKADVHASSIEHLDVSPKKHSSRSNSKSPEKRTSTEDSKKNTLDVEIAPKRLSPKRENSQSEIKRISREKSPKKADKELKEPKSISRERSPKSDKNREKSPRRATEDSGITREKSPKRDVSREKSPKRMNSLEIKREKSPKRYEVVCADNSNNKSGNYLLPVDSSMEKSPKRSPKKMRDRSNSNRSDEVIIIKHRRSSRSESHSVSPAISRRSSLTPSSRKNSEEDTNHKRVHHISRKNSDPKPIIKKISSRNNSTENRNGKSSPKIIKLSSLKSNSYDSKLLSPSKPPAVPFEQHCAKEGGSKSNLKLSRSLSIEYPTCMQCYLSNKNEKG